MIAHCNPEATINPSEECEIDQRSSWWIEEKCQNGNDVDEGNNQNNCPPDWLLLVALLGITHFTHNGSRFVFAFNFHLDKRVEVSYFRCDRMTSIIF